MGDVAYSPGDVVLQALLPQLLPQVPGDLRVGRSEVVGRHQRRVAVEHVGADRTPRVGPVEVDVGIGGAHHQGPEMGRLLRRHLPLHDAAERHAPHAHGAAAPGLGGGPFHRLVPVPPLPLRVDVGARAPRVAGAADVVADDGVAAAGEPGGPVPAVVVAALRNSGFYAAQPAVGVVLHDCRELPGASGRATTAASSTPSLIGMRTWRSSFTSYSGPDTGLLCPFMSLPPVNQGPTYAGHPEAVHVPLAAGAAVPGTWARAGIRYLHRSTMSFRPSRRPPTWTPARSTLRVT